MHAFGDGGRIREVRRAVVVAPLCRDGATWRWPADRGGSTRADMEAQPMHVLRWGVPEGVSGAPTLM